MFQHRNLFLEQASPGYQESHQPNDCRLTCEACFSSKMLLSWTGNASLPTPPLLAISTAPAFRNLLKSQPRFVWADVDVWQTDDLQFFFSISSKICIFNDALLTINKLFLPTLKNIYVYIQTSFNRLEGWK